MKMKVWQAILISSILRFYLYQNKFNSAHKSLEENWLSFIPGFQSSEYSFEKINEAFFNSQNSKSPFTGNVYKGSPLLFILLFPLRKLQRKQMKLICFALISAADIIVAILFRELMMKRNKGDEESSTTKKIRSHLNPDVLCILLILNPFSILQSLSISFQNFQKFFVLSSLVIAMKGQFFVCSFCMAISILLSPDNIMFIAPLALYYNQKSGESTKSLNEEILTYLKFAITITLFISMFFYQFNQIFGGWSFLAHSYLQQFSSEGISPNMGITWYLFSQVFGRFRMIFVIVFNTHYILTSVPLSMTLRENSFLLTVLLNTMKMIYSPYPLFADFFTYVVTLFSIRNNFKRTRYVMILTAVALYALLTSSLLWFMWIRFESININYLFVFSLIFNFCVNYTVIDIVYSYSLKDEIVEEEETK